MKVNVMHCLINDFSGSLSTNSDCLCIKRGANLVEASGFFPIGTQETGLKLGDRGGDNKSVFKLVGLCAESMAII